MTLAVSGNGCGGEGGSPAPVPPATPTPFPANASCGGCAALPCTRECLPALASGLPALRPYSGGTCPTLERGENRGFGVGARDFLLFVPSETGGPYGVVFVWHGSGGNAQAFTFLVDASDPAGYERGGYILVIPDGQARHLLDWAMDLQGVDHDLRFYDDVVACLSQQFPVDRRRVHSTGYSAGAVFSAYLMGHRSDSLASFAGWSTGEADSRNRRIVPDPPRAVPGLLYHGGRDDKPDWAGRRGTLSLAAHMTANGALAIVCDHGLGHVVPGPLDATLGQMWSFMLAHPFGDEQAWATGGLAGRLPDWCALPR